MVFGLEQSMPWLEVPGLGGREVAHALAETPNVTQGMNSIQNVFDKCIQRYQTNTLIEARYSISGILQ